MKKSATQDDDQTDLFDNVFADIIILVALCTCSHTAHDKCYSHYNIKGGDQNGNAGVFPVR